MSGLVITTINTDLPYLFALASVLLIDKARR